MREAKRLIDARDELVLDHLTVAIPILAILDSAALEVTTAPVNEDRDKERGIKVWDRRSRAYAKAPRERLDPICSIVLDEAKISDEG